MAQNDLIPGTAQGTSASCPFDQQQNMLQPTTEYSLKSAYTCQSALKVAGRRGGKHE